MVTSRNMKIGCLFRSFSFFNFFSAQIAAIISADFIEVPLPSTLSFSHVASTKKVGLMRRDLQF